MSNPTAKPSLAEFFEQTVEEFPGEVAMHGDFSIERGTEIIRADRDGRPTSR